MGERVVFRIGLEGVLILFGYCEVIKTQAELAGLGDGSFLCVKLRLGLSFILLCLIILIDSEARDVKVGYDFVGDFTPLLS